LGHLAVLQGTSVSALTSLLSSKAQLPAQFGGLQRNTICTDDKAIDVFFVCLLYSFIFDWKQ
jgi:hypothetical protein